MNPPMKRPGPVRAALAAAALLLVAGCGAPASAPNAFMPPLRAECGGGFAALFHGIEAQPDGRISTFTRGIGRADPPALLRTDPALVARWNKALDEARFGQQGDAGGGNMSCALVRGVGASAQTVRWRQDEAPPAAVAGVFGEMMALRPAVER